MSRLYKMVDIAKMEKETALKTCLIKGLEKDTLRMILSSMSNKSSYYETLRKII